MMTLKCSKKEAGNSEEMEINDISDTSNKMLYNAYSPPCITFSNSHMR